MTEDDSSRRPRSSVLGRPSLFDIGPWTLDFGLSQVYFRIPNLRRQDE